MKKNYTVQEFSSLLQKHGMYEDYLARLKTNSNMFPAHCRGKVEYILAYDAHKMKKRFVMDVQIIFDGANRFSQVKEIREMTADDYIDLCFSSPDFQDAFTKMLRYIQEGTRKDKGPGA